MKPGTWKLIATTAVAGLVALGLQASANAAGDATTSAPPPGAAPALPFQPFSEVVFHPTSPVRILDTRSSLGDHPGKISSSSPFDLQVTIGNIGLVAYAFNVTVVDPTASSYLTIWPTSEIQPTASNINYVKGQTVANFGVVTLSSAGKITIKPGAGSTHVLIDVAGYYARSVAWGPSGYVGWVQASDAGISARSFNNGQAITFAHNSIGNNTIRFNGANIGAFLTAKASIQVSTVSSSLDAVCTTAAGATDDDLNVVVRCTRISDGAPVDATFYLQVAG